MISPRRPIAVLIACVLAFAANAQTNVAPPVYVLPATERAVVVLGDAPGQTRAFEVYRRAEGETDFELVTPRPIARTADPYEAAAAMGDDFEWIARRVDSVDPPVVWRRLGRDRNLAIALGLVSHGLRVALGRTWIDFDVTRGMSYRYRVVLLDETLEEIARHEREIRIADPGRPGPPTAVTVSSQAGIVSVDWEYPPFSGGDDRTVGFVVLRRQGAGPFRTLGDSPTLRIEGYLTAFDESVVPGEEYTYAVVAVDMIGVASERAQAPPVRIGDTVAPLVPTGLKATDRGDDVLLIWRMSPELDVTHYDVYRALSVDDGAEVVQVNAEPVPYDRPRFVDAHAPRGVALFYRVVAVDRYGNESLRSGPAPMVAEDRLPPGAVTRLRALVDEAARTVTLSWNGPPDADLAGYHVYSGPDESRLMRISAAPLEPAREASYVDSGYRARGLEPGASLVYAVAAIDASFNEGPREAVEAHIPDTVPPDTPAGLAARPTRAGEVLLSWQPLLSFDLAGYRVYRSHGEATILAAELSSESTSWTDDGAVRGEPSVYALAAVDTSGNESEPTAGVRVVPTDIYAPLPPDDARAEEVRRGVRLRWEPSPDPDVRAYRVYRSEVAGRRATRLIAEVVDALEYLDRDGSQDHHYAVGAVDTSGNIGESVEVTFQ